jgi:hypothetical protein
VPSSWTQTVGNAGVDTRIGDKPGLMTCPVTGRQTGHSAAPPFGRERAVRVADEDWLVAQLRQQLEWHLRASCRLRLMRPVSVGSSAARRPSRTPWARQRRARRA